ncbi:MAG: helix-turn-helix domain-containing protein [Saccharofermentans sp.]|nr:helix-turn-helix domain-containing protein [Saccharofermentans sp.]
MEFQFKRLVELREKIGINKAEAARRLNMSAMGYGRYEKGEREPSYQTVSFIAKNFGTTTEFLYGLSDDSKAKTITVSLSENPELFLLIERFQNNKSFAQKLLDYLNDSN